MSQIASAAFTFALSAKADAGVGPADNAFAKLLEEYQAQETLAAAQPPDVQSVLEVQAAGLASALVEGQRQAHFELPERVVLEVRFGQGARAVPVPKEFRRQMVAGLLGRLPARDIRAAVRQRLAQLEQSSHPAVVVSARLVRHAVVKQMVHEMLPAGRPVTFLVTAGEVIPSAPDADARAPVALRFYMPQWVAVDGDRLLVRSTDEAEACIASMQRYLGTLHLAVSLAPYIFADEEYQRKRYGMLGQLINQGRSLARYWTGEIIGKIQRKAAVGELDRGLSLSLPYFDDQMLEMRMLEFEVIPVGRTMFVPAFVVLASRREQAKVTQDTHLSHSTRIHLLAELKTIEKAFEPFEL
jgi:hypothetical protein